MYPDEELMLNVKDGQISEMSTLFDRYQIRIYNYFRKTQMDPSLSEDLTQNVFERALKYRKSFRPDSSFKAWIYRIAANVRNDYYRDLKKSRDMEQDLMQSENTHTEFKSAEEDPHYVLNKAIGCLKNEEQQLIYLTRYENLKYAEVGKLLGYSESNVKIKIYRAMKSLRQHYFKIQDYELGR